MLQLGAGPCFARDNDYAYFSPKPFIHDIQPDYNRQLQSARLTETIKPIFQLADFFAPDLNLISQTLRAPEIQVRDLDQSIWTYKNESYHFDAEQKRFDSYTATIHPDIKSSNGAVIGLQLNKIKYETGSKTPSGMSRTYTDNSGNSLQIKRTEQMSETNPSYQQFINHFEQQSRSLTENPASGFRPEVPSQELVTGYKERWSFIGKNSHGNQTTKTVLIAIDSIEHDSNLHRFISGYRGTIQDGKQKLSFAVSSGHDIDGKIESLSIQISAKGAPTATISWAPKAGQNASAAFALLRESLPVPVLLGPRSGLRLNNVDLPENPLNVTKAGNISSRQTGDVPDLGNLTAKQDLGLTFSFAAPDKNNSGSGFSIGNSLRNVWYRVTGKFDEVQALRGQLTALRGNTPEKFVLAAGFQDPSYMSLKDLRGAIAKTVSPKEPAFMHSIEIKKTQPAEITLSGSEKMMVPVATVIGNESAGSQTRAHIHQEGDQYVLSKGRVDTRANNAIGIGSVLTVDGKTTFPSEGLTVYAGKIRIAAGGIKMGLGTLFENKKGTFYVSAQLGVVPASTDGDRFSIQPSTVRSQDGKTFQFSNLKLEGVINHTTGLTTLLAKSYQSDASVDGASPIADQIYAVIVGRNKVASITTIYKDTGLPVPDQSYEVAPGLVTNSYYLAQSEASNPNNSPFVRGAYVAMQSAMLPVALADQAINYTLNTFFFASQGGQYLARATLQPNWGDKALDTLHAISAFSNAFVAAEPFANGIVKGAVATTAMISAKLEAGIMTRLNPMNYSVEALGLGINGGNIKVVFTKQPLSLVRSELPALGKYASAFETVGIRTFKKGEVVYRSPRVDLNEEALSPGRWLGTRETITKQGTDSHYYLSFHSNPLQKLRIYEFKEDVTVYYGKVKNGFGHQIYIPSDLNTADVLKFKQERNLR